MSDQRTARAKYLRRLRRKHAKALPAILAEAGDLCRKIDPELPANLYIVPVSEMESKWRRHLRWGGFACQNAADLLTPGSRWQGDGEAMVVNDLLMKETPVKHELPPLTFRAEFLSTVLHELAHLIGGRQHVEPESKPPVAADQRDRLLSDMTDAREDRRCKTGHHEWFVSGFLQHGSQFCRLLNHVAYRASLVLGFELLPSCLLQYGSCFDAGKKSPACESDVRNLAAFKIRAALGDEPKRLADVPFSEILRLPVPAEFSALWINDVYCDFYKLWCAA